MGITDNNYRNCILMSITCNVHLLNTAHGTNNSNVKHRLIDIWHKILHGIDIKNQTDNTFCRWCLYS